ncbi:glycosyltransferase family 4 protein [Variovorax sp. J22R133]|uniref:glycosyltransferase family 4 protein n=1 Tax=Variovorax brevis TaxID=3053503 RepID=UPI002578CB41|nr:glycosyltransferase family 4 protein [Variovorax sp. J22R133]MDM0114692.1 glycosyltransferase family 4 protein [Variovorax sp. J22R133]
MNHSGPIGRPLRILIVSNLFPPYFIGGAEVVAQRQALGLRALGHDVSVFAGRIEEDEAGLGRLERECADGLVVWRTSIASFASEENFRNARTAEQFKAVLNAARPDLVHFHNVAGLGADLVPLASRRGIPTVLTLHDLWGLCYRGTMLRVDGTTCRNTEECGTHCDRAIRPHDVHHALPMRLRRDFVAWCFNHASRVISPSQALANSYVQAGVIKRNRLSVISNGIDLSPFRDMVRSRTSVVRFLCVAYLGEHKGITDLIEAARRLAAMPQLAFGWEVTIAGDGHLRPTVEAQIREFGLSEFVKCVGRVPRARVLELMSRSDVVILPSRWPENEPVSLLEAIAAGTAQLATDVGGVGALVEQGRTGMLVPPSAPQQLASAMRGYVEDPERAVKEGDANLARRNHFDEEVTTEAILAEYKKVLSQPITAPSDPLIICAGPVPDLDAYSACENLHQAEDAVAGGRRVRLAWHEWLPAEAWEEAAAFWNWGADTAFAPAAKALRWGIPIISSSACGPIVAVGRLFGGVTTVEQEIEMRWVLAKMAADPMPIARSKNARGGAEMLTALAPQESFHLRCPDNWP